MSVIETLLVFGGIPLAVVLLVWLLVYAASGRHRTPRYRPGRPFVFEPVWFLAAQPGDANGRSTPAIGGTAAREIAPGPGAVTPGVKGGARGTW